MLLQTDTEAAAQCLGCHFVMYTCTQIVLFPNDQPQQMVRERDLMQMILQVDGFFLAQCAIHQY